MNIIGDRDMKMTKEQCHTLSHAIIYNRVMQHHKYIEQHNLPLALTKTICRNFTQYSNVSIPPLDTVHAICDCQILPSTNSISISIEFRANSYEHDLII